MGKDDLQSLKSPQHPTCWPTISHCSSWLMGTWFELSPFHSPLCSCSGSMASPFQLIWVLWLQLWKCYLCFCYGNHLLPVVNHPVAMVMHHNKRQKVTKVSAKTLTAAQHSKPGRTIVWKNKYIYFCQKVFKMKKNLNESNIATPTCNHLENRKSFVVPQKWKFSCSSSKVPGKRNIYFLTQKVLKNENLN